MLGNASLLFCATGMQFLKNSVLTKKIKNANIKNNQINYVKKKKVEIYKSK